MKENTENPKITFFMPVVEQNISIADPCIRSYSKIRDIPFSLIIYLNNIAKSSKEKYVKRWSKFGYVRFVDSGPCGSMLPHGLILDQELKKINTPYVATVDYDFEILAPKFINYMLSELEGGGEFGGNVSRVYFGEQCFPYKRR